MDLSESVDPQSLFSAKGLVAVITGGGTGIGRVFATALHKTGARRIYLLARRIEPLEETARSLNGGSTGSNSTTPTVFPVQCDVTSQQAVAAIVSRIEKEVGFVDVLINNAGVLGPNNKAVYEAKSIPELQSALLNDWDNTLASFAINSAAVIGVSAAFLGLLDAANKRRGWESGQVVQDRARTRNIEAAAEGVDADDMRTSQIITVSSIAGLNRYITVGLPYSSSKAAAIHIVKTLSTLLAPWGIRSNTIAPGIYPTNMTSSNPTTYPPDKLPAGRMGTTGDLAALILYLVGKGGAYVNGNIELTDGGRLGVHSSTY